MNLDHRASGQKQSLVLADSEVSDEPAGGKNEKGTEPPSYLLFLGYL